MLSLRASSSSSSSNVRRRRGAAMSPMALSPAAALLLLRGASANNSSNATLAPENVVIIIESPTPLPTSAIITTNPPTPLPTRALPTAKPTQKKTNFVGNPPLSPLGECEGDCDDDDDCATGLVCYRRDKNGAVPGCDGGENDGSETDYCTYVGGTPPGTASPTLSPTTASPTTASPTLQPTISSAPTVSAAPSNPPSLEPTQSPTVGASAPVRLRLYWQADYHWQDTRREMFWCMQCRSGACENGSTIEVDNCGSSSRQKFQYYTGDQSYRPMDNPNLCFTENGWDAEANPIKLKPCNGSSKQRWVGFDANKRPFEIFAGRNQRYLLTQAHHPKAHERVFPQQSRRARSHKTSKWIVYWLFFLDWVDSRMNKMYLFESLLNILWNENRSMWFVSYGCCWSALLSTLTLNGCIVPPYKLSLLPPPLLLLPIWSCFTSCCHHGM